MSYKILEANGVDNENIDGGALNNLIARDKNGIVNGVLSECALTATGSLIGISPGLLILHGIRVKITEMETLTMANAPASATKYQIVAQVVLSANRSVSFSFFVQEPTALKQDELYVVNEGTYQIEFGTFTQNTDGTISDLKRAENAVIDVQAEDQNSLKKIEEAVKQVAQHSLQASESKNAAQKAASVAERAANEAASEAARETMNSVGLILRGALGQPTFFIREGRLFVRIIKGSVNPYRIENGRLKMTIVKEVI